MCMIWKQIETNDIILSDTNTHANTSFKQFAFMWWFLVLIHLTFDVICEQQHNNHWLCELISNYIKRCGDKIKWKKNIKMNRFWLLFFFYSNYRLFVCFWKLLTFWKKNKINLNAENFAHKSNKIKAVSILNKHWIQKIDHPIER